MINLNDTNNQTYLCSCDRWLHDRFLRYWFIIIVIIVVIIIIIIIVVLKGDWFADCFTLVVPMIILIDTFFLLTCFPGVGDLTTGF